MRTRSGFTLVEMMVVIVLVVILASMAAPVIAIYGRGGKVKDAASTIQATLAGARDRAMATNAPRGVRFIQDPVNKELVRSMIYVRPAPPITLGYCRVVDPNGDGAFERVEIYGALSTQFQRLPKDASNNYLGVIRFEDAGPYHSFITTDANLSGSPVVLLLDRPLSHRLPEGTYPLSPTSEGVIYEVPVGSMPLEESEPITLPNAVVIDLGQLPTDPSIYPDLATQRLSRISPDELSRSFEVMLTPEGTVIGSAAVDPQIILWVRDEFGSGADPNPNSPANPSIPLLLTRKEVRVDNSGTHALVTIYARTGYVITSDPNFLDTGNDGFYDFGSYYDNVPKGTGSGL